MTPVSNPRFHPVFTSWLFCTIGILVSNWYQDSVKVNPIDASYCAFNSTFLFEIGWIFSDLLYFPFHWLHRQFIGTQSHGTSLVSTVQGPIWAVKLPAARFRCVPVVFQVSAGSIIYWMLRGPHSVFDVSRQPYLLPAARNKPYLHSGGLIWVVTHATVR